MVAVPEHLGYTACTGFGDIVFLIDDSDSTKRLEDGTTTVLAPGQLSLVSSFIATSGLNSASGIQIQLAAYSETTRLLTSLTDDATALNAALSFTPEYQGSFAGLAISTVRTDLEANSRTGAGKVVIILTDGSTNDPAVLATEAPLLQNVATVISIAFNDGAPPPILESEQTTITGDANFNLRLNTDGELPGLLNEVVALACDEKVVCLAISYSYVPNFSYQPIVTHFSYKPNITHFPNVSNLSNKSYVPNITNPNFTNKPNVTNKPYITNKPNFTHVPNFTYKTIFTHPNFTNKPNITNKPNVTNKPNITNISYKPNFTHFANITHVSDFSNKPDITNFTYKPHVTHIPNISHKPNFSHVANITYKSNITHFSKLHLQAQPLCSLIRLENGIGHLEFAPDPAQYVQCEAVGHEARFVVRFCPYGAMWEPC
nr:hypothetical protein BaRGS_016001 [Batillaria attramentaria]